MTATTFISIAVSDDRTAISLRTAFHPAHGEPYLWTTVEAANSQNPIAHLQLMLIALMSPLGMRRLSPMRVVVDSAELADQLARHIATVHPRHRVRLFLAAAPCEFVEPDKAESKLQKENLKRAQAALEHFLATAKQVAEQAAAIEKEAVRRIAKQHKLRADREATVARSAAQRSEADAQVQAQREREKQQREQRAFDSAVNAKIAQIAGGAR